MICMFATQMNIDYLTFFFLQNPYCVMYFFLSEKHLMRKSCFPLACLLPVSMN